ncbi:carbonic anhydrase [Neomegalonema sp.]|uniref:carbonic anhydrase n=1 Tax=Neomegalonema sp. TaxID=2039713 RepID=UPI0026249666|nr:carbonic anhydrase [Neomegalonema sp.]MDD2868236.1 carbonic anhydrase [Neomegalonema sp.]
MTSAVGTPLPSYLVERYRGWKANRFEESRAWFARLVEEGQKPRTMVIGCCDSRVEPSALFGAEPGELFIMRNIANLVPPYAPDAQQHGSSAGIEYAVKSLKVTDIVIMGHSHCGGVAAFHDIQRNEITDTTDFIGRWLDTLAPAFARVNEREWPDRESRIQELGRQGVVQSLLSLMTFPYVAKAVEEGKLRLHGVWFDISDGGLHEYDPALGAFRRV